MKKWEDLIASACHELQTVAARGSVFWLERLVVRKELPKTGREKGDRLTLAT